MTDAEIAATYGDVLAKVAADALVYGVAHDAPPAVAASGFPDALRSHRASFVTLEQDGALRGCIGSVAARRSLVEDVAVNAFGAGFRDPRFPPLAGESLGRLSVGISILGRLEALDCRNEEELFAQARVGVDGFVMSAEGRRSLFLPQVWETLPTPQDFFDSLREKAGLPRRYWDPQLRIERFEVTSIPKRPVAELAVL